MSEAQSINELEEAYRRFMPDEDWGAFRLGVRAVTARMCGGLAMRITGQSGSGKSTLVDLIAGVVPEEERIQADCMTPKALFRMPRNHEGVIDLRGMLVVRDEREAQEKDHKLLRTLLARGEATDLTVHGGKSTELRLRGPISMLETSVAADANIEDDNRCLLIPLADSNARRMSVIGLISGSTATDNQQILAGCRQAMQEHQRDLPRGIDVDASVVGAALGRATAEQAGALTARFVKQVATLVKSNALLNHDCREINGHSMIAATAHDYNTVRGLLMPYITDAGTGIPSQVAELVRSTAEAMNEMARNDPKRKEFTRNDVYDWNSTMRQHAERDLKRAEEEELLLTVRRGSRGRPHLYTLAADALTRIDGVCPLPELPDDAMNADGPNPQEMRGKCA